MAASAQLLLQALSPPPAGAADVPADPEPNSLHCASGAESSCAETPLTSEPPLPDAAPLTSEPPLSDAAPPTGGPTSTGAAAGPDSAGA
ncbi:hypothetical protein [Streptomyces beigongshangae]|uniref:hypothetical protein n=1 Tax=Streptomyces beigongshangae TaxID=2841597 RepID=UPI001C84C0BE|nr:hypothetical protein [Streptomyces sp. REN17]